MTFSVHQSSRKSSPLNTLSVSSETLYEWEQISLPEDLQVVESDETPEKELPQKDLIYRPSGRSDINICGNRETETLTPYHLLTWIVHKDNPGVYD